MCINPSTIATSFGSGCSSFAVFSFSNVHSLESTGFIIYFFIFSKSSVLIFPFITYIFALFASGLSPSVNICKHSDSEFALWSNCPGKYSTPNILSFFANGYSSSKHSSTCGSEKTVFFAFSNISSFIPSTSYLFTIFKSSKFSNSRFSFRSFNRPLASTLNSGFFST